MTFKPGALLQVQLPTEFLAGLLSRWPGQLRSPAYPPRRVLVVRLDEIGDSVLTLPLFEAMRRAWPGVRLEAVMKAPAASLYKTCDLLDDVMTWQPPRHSESSMWGQVAAVTFGARRLRPRAYDLAILPRWDSDSFLGRYVAAASGANAVVGFDPRRPGMPARERRQAILLTLPVDPGAPTAHELDHLSNLAGAVGIAKHWRVTSTVGRHLISPPAADRAERIFAEARRDVRLVVAIGLGAGARKRQWSPERFADAAREISRRTSVRFLLLGSAGDTRAAVRFRARYLPPRVTSCDLTGRLTLAESAAVTDRCDAFIGCDSGLMHIAASVATPSVIVSCHSVRSSPSSVNAPERFGPWQPVHRLIRPPEPLPGCEYECASPEPHCIETVEPSEVADALDDMIAAA